MYDAQFKDLIIGSTFQFNKYDSTEWVKSSTRTARLVKNNHVFYVGNKEQVCYINMNLVNLI